MERVIIIFIVIEEEKKIVPHNNYTGGFVAFNKMQSWVIHALQGEWEETGAVFDMIECPC